VGAVIRPEKTIEKLQRGGKIVVGALGDSLTFGWMVRKGYLDFWKEMIKEAYPRAELEIINAGLPGDTAEGGKERLTYDILPYHPDCVLVEFALNDAYQGYPVPVFEGNVKAIIEEIHARSQAEVILLTSVYLDNPEEYALAERFYHCLEKIARLYELPIARVHEWWRKKIEEGEEFRSLVQYDLVHPTEKGYHLMAEALMELFR